MKVTVPRTFKLLATDWPSLNDALQSAARPTQTFRCTLDNASLHVLACTKGLRHVTALQNFMGLKTVPVHSSLKALPHPVRNVDAEGEVMRVVCVYHQSVVAIAREYGRRLPLDHKIFLTDAVHELGCKGAVDLLA